MSQTTLATVDVDAYLESELARPVIPLTDFLKSFRGGLLKRITTTNPPVYTQRKPAWTQLLMSLKRRPFESQIEAVQALATLLLDRNEKACVLNAEMGTGKTMMAICLAAILDAAGIKRHLIISPPHLVYKWRREILDTIPNASVWVINGPDAIARLIKIKAMLASCVDDGRPQFFILGRVRMRMGFHWRNAVVPRSCFQKHETLNEQGRAIFRTHRVVYAACPDCATIVSDEDNDPIQLSAYLSTHQRKCSACKAPLWSLMRPGKPIDPETSVQRLLVQLPTIGPKTAEKLVHTFGAELLAGMLDDNIHEFVNLLYDDGELVFTDRQAERIGKALSKIEFSLNGGAPYQPTEFIKRYLPADAFGSLIADEAHEYKAAQSAQGQAYAVLAGRIRKVILLTGTLMSGYADDLFYLLFRAMPARYLGDGFRFNSSRTLGTAAMAFMQQYGVLKTITRQRTGDRDGPAFKTAKGKQSTTTISRAPGFSPAGIARYVLPYTVFLKLRDIGQSVLPPYAEEFVHIPMSTDMEVAYSRMRMVLVSEMRAALAKGDHTLVGVVLNVLLAWPETCFRMEVVKHPRNKAHVLHLQASIFEEEELSPKEAELVKIVTAEVAAGRRVLVYTTYTDTRDTTGRIRQHLQRAGIKAVVMKSTVATEKREDWISDQVDNGAQVLICNPELVKTGLDLLEFPTIVFMNTGYNTYTVLQAARRSFRIGQRNAVRVVFLGYTNTAQIACLQLMAKKIKVAQSTSGDMPDTGLDALNEEDSDSLEVMLAKELLAA